MAAARDTHGHQREKAVRMPKQKIPSTGALRALKQAGVEFNIHRYKYEPRGGTKVSSRELQVEHQLVIKTLVMEDHQGKPMIVLMPGTHEVSTRELARQLGVKAVKACKPEVAQKHSGYQVGGTSPFGTRKPMPVYAEKRIFELSLIYINGGQRGLLVSMNPQVLRDLLDVEAVEVARLPGQS